MELYEISKDLLLSKGLYIRDPCLPNIEQINFVEKQGFLWDISGKKRPYSWSTILHNIISKKQELHFNPCSYFP